jgi:hypothetical protein
MAFSEIETWFKMAMGEERGGLRRRGGGGGIFTILLSVVVVCRGVLTGFIGGCVGDMCTVTWRGEKYRVECTPSFLLALATVLASAEGVSYIDIYR